MHQKLQFQVTKTRTKMGAKTPTCAQSLFTEAMDFTWGGA